MDARARAEVKSALASPGRRLESEAEGLGGGHGARYGRIHRRTRRALGEPHAVLIQATQLNVGPQHVCSEFGLDDRPEVMETALANEIVEGAIGLLAAALLRELQDLDPILAAEPQHRIVELVGIVRHLHDVPLGAGFTDRLYDRRFVVHGMRRRGLPDARDPHDEFHGVAGAVGVAGHADQRRRVPGDGGVDAEHEDMRQVGGGQGCGRIRAGLSPLGRHELLRGARPELLMQPLELVGAEGGGLFCVVAGAAGAPLPGHAPARRADVPIDEDAAAYVHPERDRVVRLGGLGKDPERHPAALRELAGGELDALLDPGLGECPEQLRLALVAGVGFDPALRGGGVDGGGPGDAGGRTRSP